MRKYVLLPIIVASLICTKSLATVYSPDLIAAHKFAEKKCQGIGYEPGKIIYNPIDSGSFFVCDVDGHPNLEYCGLNSFEIEGISFPEMYNKTTTYCEQDYFLSAIEAKRANGDYAGVCDPSTICDCRDNPSYKKRAGACKCSDFGTHLDYSTCVFPPTCPPMKDINDVNQATYDPTTSACYVPANYTFGDNSGNYQFTSGCIYSN